MSTQSPQVEAPILDGRTREARMVAELCSDLKNRLGASPCFEARALAEQIIRTRLDIARLERKRAETGSLSDYEHELLIRRENLLMRATRRLERLAPAPKRHEPSLSERIRAERASVREAA